MIGRLLIAFTYLYGGLVPQLPDLVTVHASDSNGYPGMKTCIAVVVNVKEGYHIQADKVNDELLIPTTLEIKNNEFFSISKLEFPPNKQFKLEGADSFLNVYEGNFEIKLFLVTDKKAIPGKYRLAAKLRYQACDYRSCLFPKTIDFSIPIDVKTKE